MSSVPTTRRRKVRLRHDHYMFRDYLKANTYGAVDIDGEQVTVSEGHPWTSHKKFQGEDIGGDFFTIKRGYHDARDRVQDPQPQHHFGPFWNGSHTSTSEYFGPVYPVSPYTPGLGMSKWFPPDLSSSDSQLAAKGATAISRCKPTTSPASLSIAMAELIREGLPSMIGHETWQNRAKDYRDLGGEYLNVQFGWLPFVSDIKATYSAIAKWDKLITQYERDAGKLVRRRYEFPLEKTVDLTEITPSGGADLYLANQVLPVNYTVDGIGRSNRRLFREREITRRTWFSGGFTYHLPSDYHSRNAVRRIASQASDVLGLEITPEVLWNLMPWSWAVDWFTNIGDVLSNVSDYASDGLVLRYGYLMETTIVKDTYTNVGANLRTTGRLPITSTFITEVKKRRRATPFGFGLTFDSFSERQLAIIAALGISRGPR